VFLTCIGGPCSGKTSAINALPPTLGGFELLKVPEAATLYFERGGALPFGTDADLSGEYSPLDRNLLWEAWLIELKISLENAAHAASAARVNNVLEVEASASLPPCAVVCDRGILDSRAYLSNDVEWEQLLGLAGWDEAELLSRYKGVVCLAVAPEEYYNLGNEARHESFEVAQQRHGATWDAWRKAAERCDARAARQHADDFAAEFDLSGTSRSPSSSSSSGSGRHRAPSPVLVANPQDNFGAAAFSSEGGLDVMSSPFEAKSAALRSCIESTLLEHSLSEAASNSCGSIFGSGRRHLSSSSSSSSDGRQWSMPIDFIVAQAHAVATSSRLGSRSRSSSSGIDDSSSVYARSVALLRGVQSARRGDPEQRKFLAAAQQRDASQSLFRLEF